MRIGREGDSDEDAEKPYLERTFRHEETREVRVYLRGGSDRTEITGAQGRIAVRIDGGGGGDAFTNDSDAGASKTYFYDHRGNNRFVEGKGATVDQRPYERPTTALVWSRYAFDWGMQASTRPIIGVDPDLGVFARVLHARTYFGFRKDPFATRHSFDIGLASSGFTPFLGYTGTFRHVRPNTDARLALEYSGFEVTRFKGFGNDIGLEHPSSFYKLGAAAPADRAGPGVPNPGPCGGGRNIPVALGTDHPGGTGRQMVEHPGGFEPGHLHRFSRRSPVRHGFPSAR